MANRKLLPTFFLLKRENGIVNKLDEAIGH